MASYRVVKEKNESYTVRISLKDDNGDWRTVTKRGFERKGDAKAYGDAELNKITGGTYTRPTRMTVEELATKFTASLPARCRPATVRAYTYWTKKRIVPRWRHREVTSLRPEEIEEWLVDLQAGDKDHKPISAESARYAHATLRRMLKDAQRWGIVGRNVASLATAPKSDTREREPLSAAETRTLLETVAGQRDEALWRLAVTTGMRLGELCGLRVEDLDLDRVDPKRGPDPVVRIRQIRTVVGGRLHSGPRRPQRAGA